MKVGATTVLLGLVLMISGCAVSRAAHKTGVELRTAAACKTLSCLEALPTSEILEKSVYKSADGQSLEEGTYSYVFRMQRREGSTGRAVFHAGADVMTLGLWEVAGTPIEGAVQNDKKFIVRAICTPATDECETVDVVGYDKATGKVEESSKVTTAPEPASPNQKDGAEAGN